MGYVLVRYLCDEVPPCPRSEVLGKSMPLSEPQLSFISFENTHLLTYCPEIYRIK